MSPFRAGFASLLIFIPVCVGVGALLDPARSPPASASAFYWVLGVALGLMLVEPWFRRGFAFSYILSEFEAAHSASPWPNVVAHSLGTYLTGHLLYERDRLFLGRVIFTGCVLEREFPWSRIVGPRTRQGCHAVNNFVGGNDKVPRLTGFLRENWKRTTFFARGRLLREKAERLSNLMRWRPLGRAGHLGFIPDQATVHSLEADTGCTSCAGPDSYAVVHNITSRFSGHSTLNQIPDYQLFQWLPFLCGNRPDKFDYWKEICRLGNAALVRLGPLAKSVIDDSLTPAQLEDYIALRNAERRMITGPWYFPLDVMGAGPIAGRPLIDYVDEMIAAIPGYRGLPAAQIVERLPAILFMKFAAALAERKVPAPRSEVTALLDCRLLLIAAFTEASRTVPPRARN